MHPEASLSPIPNRSRDPDRTFSLIEQHYHRFYEVLEREGTGSYRLTALGAWATSRAAHVFHFFKEMDLARYRLFMDLGSGDGIVTCIAGLFTQAVGIEIDPELCRIAQKSAQRLQLDEHVRFICANFLTQPIRKADCLYLYPDKPFYALEEYLTGWTGTLVVYGPHMPPKRMLPIRRLRYEKEQLVLYRQAPHVKE